MYIWYSFLNNIYLTILLRFSHTVSYLLVDWYTIWAEDRTGSCVKNWSCNWLGCSVSQRVHGSPSSPIVLRKLTVRTRIITEVRLFHFCWFSSTPGNQSLWYGSSATYFMTVLVAHSYIDTSVYIFEFIISYVTCTIITSGTCYS